MIIVTNASAKTPDRAPSAPPTAVNSFESGFNGQILSHGVAVAMVMIEVVAIVVVVVVDIYWLEIDTEYAKSSSHSFVKFKNAMIGKKCCINNTF